MKKKIILGLFTICLLFTSAGCGKTVQKEKKNDITGGWEILLTDRELSMSKEAKNAFLKATKDYKKLKLDLVALLGEQVVSGKNYMYLAKGYQEGEKNKATYKIVTVYNDLKNKASITKVKNFDYTKYVNKNIKNNYEKTSGGWYINSISEKNLLDKKVQTIFNEATAKLKKIKYRPIATLGTQVVSGTNYAVLCYGSKNFKDDKEAVYLITLYEDLEGNKEVISQSYVDISKFYN